MHKLLRRFLGLGATKTLVVSEDEAANAQRIARMLIDVGRDLSKLREDHEELKLKFSSFQGRVYAWRRGGQAGIPTEAPEKPAELPLSDPRVSKEELRARLLKPGKPFKHTN